MCFIRSRLDSIKRHSQGYTRFEIMLVVVLVLVFIGIALKVLVNFSADTERLEMQEVVESIQTSVLTVMSENLMGYGLGELVALDATNPMKLLKLAPANYVGELKAGSETPGKGSWYFNSDLKVLIYRVKHVGHFVAGSKNEGEAIFKLQFNYADTNNNQQFDAEIDTPHGLVFEPVYPYEWVK